MRKALLLIDLQHDYFPDGAYPLWNAQAVLDNIERATEAARAKGIPIIVVQHVADEGLSPFFVKGTHGAEVHPRVLAAAPDAPIVVKTFADSFEQTNLEAVLSELGVDTLLVAGMMTQNCVTHTAISKAAEKYDVRVLADCCTTVDEMLHMIALHALSPRVALSPALDAIGG